MLDLTQFKKVLTFFAHPDDETLAAGGTISKLTSLGADVRIAIPATGVHGRRNIQKGIDREKELIELRNDCANALSVLGVPAGNLYLGEFQDNEMDKHSRLELIHWLEKIIGEFCPDLILTHHRYCTNIDHQYCHDAVVVATRPSLKSHITVLCGEVPSSTGYLKPVQWEPNCYIELSENNLNAKIEAMESYFGEARSDPHPRSKEVLCALSKVRGSESGYFHAECFMIQKIFA